jgi:hypothetical protein
MSLDMDLTGHVVAVTGGTGGIGRAIVEAMLQANARVAFCAPDADECDRVVNELSNAYGPDRALGIPANLLDRASLAAFVERVDRQWAPINTLVCNAADFGRPNPVPDTELDVYLRVLEANVVNNFYLCQQVLPVMVERGSGSIVLLTSITGYTSNPTNVPYASSKAALASIARSLAAEYAPHGVRVNCVSPGLIKTEASRPIWDREDGGAGYIADKIPARRIGRPEEIAPLCVFLASDHSTYINAATLPVDGGRLGIGQSTGMAPPTRQNAPASA